MEEQEKTLRHWLIDKYKERKNRYWNKQEETIELARASVKRKKEVLWETDKEKRKKQSVMVNQEGGNNKERKKLSAEGKK